MMDLAAVDAIVRRAASASMKDDQFSETFSEPTRDSEGQDAIRVTIVITNGTQLSGDDALNAIFNINNELLDAGEKRFAIIDFATEDEMTSNGDFES